MSPLYPNPGSYLVYRFTEYILCQGRVPFVARQFNIPLNILDLVVIQSDLHQIVQIFLLRVYIINSDFPTFSEYFILWGTSPIWIKSFLTPRNIEICVTREILHQFPRFFLSRVHKNIPEFSVYSEYFISWGERRYRFYKVVES